MWGRSPHRSNVHVTVDVARPVEIEIDDVLADRPLPERGLPRTLTGWMTTT